MPANLVELLKSLPQQPQRQDSTNAQIADLIAFANRLGLYDAADYLNTVLKHQYPPERKSTCPNSP